jgi:hypothetical protein
MAGSSAGGAEGRRRARRYTMRCRARGRRHGAEEHDDVEVREDQGSRGGAEEGVGLEGRRWRPERWRLGAGPSEVRAMTLSAWSNPTSTDGLLQNHTYGHMWHEVGQVTFLR